MKKEKMRGREDREGEGENLKMGKEERGEIGKDKKEMKENIKRGREEGRRERGFEEGKRI